MISVRSRSTEVDPGSAQERASKQRPVPDHGTSVLPALHAWWPPEAASALRISLTAIGAIWLAMRLEFEAPHWAGWTVISVTLATRAASLQKSLWRAGATVIGVAVAIAIVANFAQATLAFDVVLALWLGLLTAASSIESGQRAYGFALMGLTVPIVTYANVQHPEAIFTTGIDRCSTILLGIACAHAANVLVASGVPAVSRGLAARLDATADACAEWLAAVRRGEPAGPAPAATVMAFGEAVTDALVEHPSLRSGGRAIRNAAPRLRHVLAAGLLSAHLPDRRGAPSSALLGDGPALADRQIARVRVAGRLLRAGDRIGRRRVPLRLHLLIWNDLDWDGRLALNNGLRTIATLSIVNAFWYVTGWSHGAGAATWAALLAVLLASHPDPRAEAYAFLVGGILASVVGLTLHYTLLTTSGDFPLLAAVLLPVCLLAVVGRSDKRAVYGAGYGFLVLGVIAPTNVMTYDLAGSLNQVLAQLIGMGIAVVAFSALPPPVSGEARRRRARRRLVRGLHQAALAPAWLLPPRKRWLARAFGRLDALGADARTVGEGERLLLIGMLLLALREADDALGRSVGRNIWASLCGDGSAGFAPASSRPEARECLQAEQIAALTALAAGFAAAGWPGFTRKAVR